MPAQFADPGQKFWVFDGSVAQYPSVFTSGSVHLGRDCTYCHGGHDEGTARTVAHVSDFDRFATASPQSCQDCTPFTPKCTTTNAPASMAG